MNTILTRSSGATARVALITKCIGALLLVGLVGEGAAAKRKVDKNAMQGFATVADLHVEIGRAHV